MSAVFSGAGLSRDEPAGLPLGWDLRNAVLQLCFDATRSLIPDLASPPDLDQLLASTLKLEVVLGRVEGTVGPDSLDLLRTLDLRLPNEGHLLAALALARGFPHVTVNLDEGIEMAYRLLVGESTVPAGSHPDFAVALHRWRALVPHPHAPLRVVASEDEFTAWARTGERCGVLLKIHGSLRRSDDTIRLVDPVVVDEVEYARLSQAKLQALGLLASADQVLVTGYRGMDIDVYDPLLAALSGIRSTWAAPEVDGIVRTNLADLGCSVMDGATRGTAVAALRDALGMPPGEPWWPMVPAPGPSFDDRLADWQRRARVDLPKLGRAEAYAWLLADLGRYRAAWLLLDRLHRISGRRPSPRLLNRMADVAYDMNAPGTRWWAMRAWLKVLIAPRSGIGLRAYACVRVGEVCRSATFRGPVIGRPLVLVMSVCWMLAALALTGDGLWEPVQAARAYSALCSIGLRLLEVWAPYPASAVRPLARALAWAAARAGRRALRTGASGNRQMFVRQQHAEVVVIQCMLRGNKVPHSVVEELTQIRLIYLRADDLRGVANCTAALGLAQIVDGDHAGMALLDEAEALYHRSRVDVNPDPSGLALVARRRLLAQRLGVRAVIHGGGA